MELPVFILLGSNISPEGNIRSAYVLLKNLVDVRSISPIWETPSVGSPGPNFLNLAVEIRTSFSIEDLKNDILRSIEAQLGRVRTQDKNAPRTIDLDILIYADRIIEPKIWSLAHIACPLSGLLPELRHPDTDLPLAQIAENMQKHGDAYLRSDLDLKMQTV